MITIHFVNCALEFNILEDYGQRTLKRSNSVNLLSSIVHTHNLFTTLVISSLFCSVLCGYHCFFHNEVYSILFYFLSITWRLEALTCAMFHVLLIFKKKLLLDISANHISIAKNVGLEVIEYRYWNAATRTVDFDGLIQDLSQAKPGSFVVLHACAHNPTGMDPTKEQWEKIVTVVKVIFPFDIYFYKEITPS